MPMHKNKVAPAQEHSKKNSPHGTDQKEVNIHERNIPDNGNLNPGKEIEVQEVVIEADANKHVLLSCPDTKDIPCNGELNGEISDHKDDEDPWNLVIKPSTDKPWSDLRTGKKICRILSVTVKALAIVLLLYLFICSLDLLGSAFQLIGGRTAGEAFKSDLLTNPICCLIIGIWVTVLLQSSSTTTSIVVTMVASNILSVEQAIYIVMGTNIGTSFTSSLVALSQVADRNQFRRAFAGSIILYIFNLLTVTILLPIEWAFGYLYWLTKAIVDSMDLTDATTEDEGPKFLSVITEPFLKLIIEVDKGVLTAIATDSFEMKRPLTKYLCEEIGYLNYTDFPYGTDVTQEQEYITVQDSKTHPLLWAYDESIETIYGNGTSSVNASNTTAVTRFSYYIPDFEDEGTKSCGHMFVGSGLPGEYESLDGWPYVNMSDAAVGTILLLISVITLCACLVGMVKLLNSLLKGALLGLVRKFINADFPGGVVGRELTGYFMILIGAIMTILVQSSSVFTSALNPLIGMGIVTLQRTYPLTLGANIGTTVTSLLAAFTAEPETIGNALQVSFAHLFFNVTGIILFYPIPKIRKFPCWTSQQIGNITADYKWFAVLFLCMTYIILPLIVFALSIPGWQVLVGVMFPVLLFLAIIIAINIMQYRCPNKLPKRFRSWDWCPLALHSLEPYDKLLEKSCPCKICQKQNNTRSGSTDDISSIATTVMDDNIISPEERSNITLEREIGDSGNVSLDDDPKLLNPNGTEMANCGASMNI